jgi:hypothetical protein
MHAVDQPTEYSNEGNKMPVAEKNGPGIVGQTKYEAFRTTEWYYKAYGPHGCVMTFLDDGVIYCNLKEGSIGYNKLLEAIKESVSKDGAIVSIA